MKKIVPNFKKFPKSFLALFFIIALMIITLSSLFFFHQNKTINKPLPELADQILKDCSYSDYKAGCYENEIPSLLDKPYNLKMEEAFQVVKLVQNQDQTFPFCHVLGHKIAAKETHKDLSRWKEVISKCPSGVCSNGCAHGAFQERFRAESLSLEQVEKIKPELEIICRARDAWKPSGIEQGSCYHALGHLLTYMTNANLLKSVELCRELAISENRTDFTKVCFDGVFMQIFQPIEPEDFALVKNITPALPNVKAFCAPFDTTAQASCWNESWPLQINELKQPDKLVEFCSYLKGGDQQRCFSTMFYIMPIQFQFDMQKLTRYCSQMPQENKGECFAQVSQRLVQTDYDNIDKAISFCNSSLPYDPQENCFSLLASQASFNFLPGSPEYQTMCNSLPPKWKERCQ
jgi:hypothetical protein